MKEKIEKALAKIRAGLQQDGGDIELVSVDKDVVKVRLKGACGCCPMSQMTLKNFVEAELKKAVPEITKVEAVVSMRITKQKDLTQILKYLAGEERIFLIGCGECSTTCKTGGEEEVKAIKLALEKAGKTVTGSCVPEAPCIAAKVKSELAKHRKAIESSDSILVLACGLGVQSVKENLRSEKAIHVGCDTLFMGQVDASGVFLERCSACGDCVLELTGLICPITRCPKSMLNGPCGGQNKGKCEIDKNLDCAWILIYNELKKKGKLHLLKEIRPPIDHSKMKKPRQATLK